VTRILGVDPGLAGGLAIVELDGVAPRLLDAIDVPVVGLKAKVRVDVIGIRTWIEAHGPDHAIVEAAQSMPRQGVASTFRYGRATGAIEAIIALAGIPLTLIAPASWKRHHGLYGAEKESSRQRALQLFPAAHTLFARKMDHGRAEAALIALVPIHGISAPAEKTQPKASISSASQAESKS
jgi:crossover junction endodeoxyribonuclease RuvC